LIPSNYNLNRNEGDSPDLIHNTPFFNPRGFSNS